MKTANYIKGIALASCLMVLNGCTTDFLQPDPLSFYEPGVTFSTESGLAAALLTCDKHLRDYYVTDFNLCTEYIFSDMGVRGKTDDANMYTNISARLVPTSMGENTGWYWTEGFNGIKYANTVISYIDKVEGLSEATRNAYLGRAYFHRSFRYLMLAFQYNNLPLVSKLVEVPKQNYYSIQREALLKMLVKDMEFAIQWVPSQADMTSYGVVNKEACRQLLIKCYLVDGQFDKAKEQADILIGQSGLSLLKGNVGTFNPGGRPETWQITRNVIWDMHRPENKLIPANTETILGVVKQGSGDSFGSRFRLTREFGPFWSGATTKDADGKQAVRNYARSDRNYNPAFDYLYGIGRGIADFRPSWFATQSVWVLDGVKDAGDLRHSAAVGNWFPMDSLKYNDPTSRFFGKTFAEEPPVCQDTIRNWFDFPLYKIFLADQLAIDNLNNTGYEGATLGSVANWYVYRLAETYLLRAEANYYLGNAAEAAKDVNEIRKRANCTVLYPEDGTFTIGGIMDERARELYLEEFRHFELSRVSYCLALSGKPDEWGNTYDVATYDKQEGTDPAGGSYWYQRITHYNNFYNSGVSLPANGNIFTYTINKRNLYWPVPNSAIKDNSKGVLAQNYGYDGYDPNVKMWNTWEEAVADEDRVE
jgi:hypothetical protein